MDIPALLTTLSSATALAKSLLEIKAVSESSEAKMAIADLTTALADLKISAAGLKEEILEKDENIRELKKLLERREELVRDRDLYFERGDDGNPIGDPFCPRCFEGDDKLIHLVYRNETYVACPVCDKSFPINPGHRSSVGVVRSRRPGSWMGS